MIWAVIESQQPPLWQADLDAYLSYLKANSTENVRVLAVEKAEYPWNFTDEMSHQVFNESAYFPPYPYPPKDLWCALVEFEGSQTVVYIALHQNLYNADVLLHESGKTIPDPQLSTDLDKIGCALP